ncbi:peptidyl-prolyl cis-trans isomerase [Cyclobacteriaceae bacterium]|nr:peptidyl-prolyl cis-trans isomerase [Cyclobacteriaceae bacterium]
MKTLYQRSLCLLLFMAFFLSCDYLNKKQTPSSLPIARVGDNYLYGEDIAKDMPLGLSVSDSGRLVDKYVDDWVKKQLLIIKANEELSINAINIDRKVEDYRYALIMHEFEKIYIGSHLNTEVTQEEIESYYHERSDNFLLKQNIVRCIFAKIPSSAPDIFQIRRNIRNYPNTDIEDIKNYCYQFADLSFLDDSVWIGLDELVVNTPLAALQNKTQFLEKTVYSETRDESYIYLFRMVEYKISDQIAPLEYVKEDIENIIINKRKLALKKDLHETIYEEALKTKKFEIYSN